MKKWIVAALVATLSAPLYGASAFSIGAPLVGFRTETYYRPTPGGVFLSATAPGFTAVASDPNGKLVIPLGMNVEIRAPHSKLWLAEVDNGRALPEALASTTDGKIVWTKEAILNWLEAKRHDPGSLSSLVLIAEVLDKRKNQPILTILIWEVNVGGSWTSERQPSTFGIQFDNWCGWKPGQPWREPAARFWQDRVTWNRATEVSDLTPSGQEAGTENWTAKWANQLGPGNSVLAKVRFEDGSGKGVDPRGGFGLFFLTKAEKAVPFSLPGSLCELVRLPKDWHALPEGLRAAIADMGLQPWLLTWNGDRRAATFVIPLAIRQAVAESFPLQPGLRRLVIVGADGFEALNGLQMSFSTDHAGQDVRVLVPTGQGNGNLPRLWLDIRGFPVSEMNEGVEASPIAPAVRETEAPAQPAPQPDEVPQRLE
jgi:hypothetical protein